MRYQHATGLCEKTIDEITCRIADVIEGRGMDLSRCRIPLRDQVVTCLLTLRQNLPQMVVADLLGVCQPTISRILATYHRPPRNSPALPPWRTRQSDPARTPHPHRQHPCPLPGTAQPADKPATTTTPGNTRPSASMSRSPPPTAVTSSPSLTRCRDPDTTRRPSTCVVGKTSSTPPAPPGSPTPPTSSPPPSPRSRSYPTNPAPTTTKTSTLPSPESASTSNTASHN